MKSRDDRMAMFKIIDCTVIARQEKMQIDADHIDFETRMFERRIHIRGVKGVTPLGESVRLLQAFLKRAKKADKGTKEVTFMFNSWFHNSKAETPTESWQCLVVAYVDKKTGARCLEFSEAVKESNK